MAPAADLVTRARAGDPDAFRELTEPHRRELLAHCYRMLGSLQDAEDAVQDTLMSAWKGLGGFERRASVRTWLYRIATNRCINSLRASSRRPAAEWSNPAVTPPEPTRLGDVTWLEPYPDELLHRAMDMPLGPEARYEQTEAISLAFVTALQMLPARQRAVLILRDVLGYRADEVAGLLGSTLDSVNSALKRARATLQRQSRPGGEQEPAPAPESSAERSLVAEIVRAYEAGRIDALVPLLSADASLTMPPLALEYHGREAVGRFLAAISAQDRRFELLPARANRQLAFATYVRSSARVDAHGTGLDVFTLSGAQIRAITHFDCSVLPSFGLPLSLHGR